MPTTGELLELKLSQLPQILRCAVAMACAERVLTIYYSFEDDPTDDLIDAVASTWEYVDTGVVNNHDELKQRYERLINASEIEAGDEDEDLSPLYYSIVSIAYALNSIWDESIGSAELAMVHAIDAVQFSAVGNPDEAVQEEESFQQAVLERALSWGGKPIDIEMFEDLSDGEPKWEQALSGIE